MGGSLSQICREAKRGSGNDEMDNSALEVLKSLEDMAQDHIDTFFHRIRNSASDERQIPIKTVLNKTQFIQCIIEKNSNLGDDIKDCVKTFQAGPVADGLTNLASSVLTDLLGSSTGRRATQERYAIYINRFGGLQRLDCTFFVYTFEAKAIKTCTSVVACCIVQSSVNIDNIEPETFAMVVRDCFSASPPHIQKLIYDEIKWKALVPAGKFPTSSNHELTADEKKEKEEHMKAMNKYREEEEAKHKKAVQDAENARRNAKS